MITPENVVRHELIGLLVMIEESSNRSLKGLNGRVVDETRQTLTIDVSGKEKKVPKEECLFRFTLPSKKKVRISGKLLVARPEDRVKKKLKTW